MTVSIAQDQLGPAPQNNETTTNFSFNAPGPPTNYLSYSVSQIRAAYGINKIRDFGSRPADGSGQTIAIVDAWNDPTIVSDLDGFDEAMHVTSNSGPTLFQQFGPASSILTVYNQFGQNITSEIADTGQNGVPGFGPERTEETIDVEWAHALAPAAKIDLIETTGQGPTRDLFNGVGTAARLPGVSVVSMSWGTPEGGPGGLSRKFEQWQNKHTFVTPKKHIGETFLAASGDSGIPGGFPAFSRKVVAVGATQLLMNGSSYGSETAWSYPSQRTVTDGGASYSTVGLWKYHSAGNGNLAGLAPREVTVRQPGRRQSPRMTREARGVQS